MFNKNIEKANPIKIDKKKKSLVRRLFKYFSIAAGVFITIIIIIICWFNFILIPSPDYSDLTEYHPFKSEETQKEFFKHYDEWAKDWPVPAETKIIKTSYGSTFVKISGPKDGIPLVLIPGGGKTSLMWIPNVEELSRHYKVYALDNIFDFGKSVLTRPMENGEQVAEWLDEVFNELNLGDEINIAGLSFGGWVTSQYVIYHSERINKAILIAPFATLFNIQGQFLLNALKVLIFPSFVDEWTRLIMTDLNNKTDDTSIELMDRIIKESYFGMTCVKYKNSIRPVVLRDEDWESINAPILLLVGENEKLYSADDAVQRLDSLNTTVKTEIIPDAGHDLTFVQSSLVNSKIIKFIKEDIVYIKSEEEERLNK